MQEWINWCNSNQGYVTALLSLLLVVLTLIYVITTIAIAWFNKKNLTLIADLEKERVRPYMVFNILIIYGDSRTVATQLRNYGLTAAYNVKVTTDPKLSIVGTQTDIDDVLSNTPIKFVPPNYEIINHLGNSSDFRRKYENNTFKGSIEYEDIQGRRYREGFEINLPNLTRITTHTITQTYTLEEMFSNFDKQIKEGE